MYPRSCSLIQVSKLQPDSLDLKYIHSHARCPIMDNSKSTFENISHAASSSFSDGHLTDLFLSNETTLILQWIIYNIVCQAIDLLGIVTNIINIICFVKQGFKETTNISLLGKEVNNTCLYSTSCDTC